MLQRWKLSSRCRCRQPATNLLWRLLRPSTTKNSQSTPWWPTRPHLSSTRQKVDLDFFLFSFLFYIFNPKYSIMGLTDLYYLLFTWKSVISIMLLLILLLLLLIFFILLLLLLSLLIDIVILLYVIIIIILFSQESLTCTRWVTLVSIVSSQQSFQWLVARWRHRSAPVTQPHDCWVRVWFIDLLIYW